MTVFACRILLFSLIVFAGVVAGCNGNQSIKTDTKSYLKHSCPLVQRASIGQTGYVSLLEKCRFRDKSSHKELPTITEQDILDGIDTNLTMSGVSPLLEGHPSSLGAVYILGKMIVSNIVFLVESGKEIGRLNDVYSWVISGIRSEHTPEAIFCAVNIEQDLLDAVSHSNATNVHWKALLESGSSQTSVVKTAEIIDDQICAIYGLKLSGKIDNEMDVVLPDVRLSLSVLVSSIINSNYVDVVPVEKMEKKIETFTRSVEKEIVQKNLQILLTDMRLQIRKQSLTVPKLPPPSSPRR